VSDTHGPLLSGSPKIPRGDREGDGKNQGVAVSDVALDVRGISKTFGGQKALSDVSVGFQSGVVTALLGENGSGKSTLIKIVAGYYEPDPGCDSIRVHGELMPLPVDSYQIRAAGVAFLHQDLALVPEMSVLDNFGIANGFFGRMQLGLVRPRTQRDRLQSLLRRFDVGASPDVKVGDLPSAQQTMVAIVRAFATAGDTAPIIILDEPTAALPEAEVEVVFGALRTAVAEGATVIYVSHRIDEVRQIASHLVVLRDGLLVSDRPLAGLSTHDVVELIVGHPVNAASRGSSSALAERPLLVVRGLRGPRLKGVGLELRRGEILGLTGLLGCGRSELARMVAGAQVPAAGSLELDGRPLVSKSPRDAHRRGVGYVPQNRRQEGVIGEMRTRENVTLSVLFDFWERGHLNSRKEKDAARGLAARLRVSPNEPEGKLGNLSGGNQQKAVLARNVALDLQLLVLDEPTQGIDVGAREEVGATIRELAASGIGVLLASSDYEELAQLCDRVLVLDRGCIAAEIEGHDLTQDQLTATCLATGDSTAGK
jgi:ribose transport system ATP-binding protein